jgi:UDP-N-acetylmuramate--alanine ligase
MENIDLAKIHKIFFVGIGGIGISAAARLLHAQGKEVSGSDLVANEITEQLIGEGIKVSFLQAGDNIDKNFDLVVYTVAAPEDNPDRQAAKKLGIRELTYPQLLGLMMDGLYPLGVCGTNGKTTVTAMMGLIFKRADLDPTIVLGGKADYLGGNSILGKSKYFIFESDEYRRAFDNYNPMIAVVTYIASDHLDYYPDLEAIKSAFKDYLHRVPAEGVIFINADDENSLDCALGAQARQITFGLDSPADLMATNIRLDDGVQRFDLFWQGKILGELALSLPAKYNIYDALAAIGPALYLGVDFEIIQSAVSEFKGSWRRFERLGRINGASVVADFAHTPDAVAQTIVAAKEFFNGKVLTIFQPHQYSRTKNFFTPFAEALCLADKAIIMDIYYVVGREKPEDFDVSGEKLALLAKDSGGNVSYGGTDLFSVISQEDLKDYKAVLILGAGDIYGSAKKLKFDS